MDAGCNHPASLKTRRGDGLLALRDFADQSLERFSHDRTQIAQDSLIEMFRQVSENVPAYRRFLEEQGVDPNSILTYEDFSKLPAITKENYIQRYPLADLCAYGKLERCDMIAVSSGSTGTPTFWPRFLTDELQVTARFEQIFRDSFRADERRTLAVICFALGTWVGGMYTASCCRHLALKGYPITVITPGNNKEEIFRVVEALGGQFDQVVLLGYPPFLKDVIDTGPARGIEWSRFKIKLVTAGEVFSEEWRSLVGERTGSTEPCFDSASLYGTADAGVLGNETPLSICIRRFLSERPDASRALFGESRLPTLVQYDPVNRFFEEENGSLLFSGMNGFPLIRYNILDRGGIIGYEAMMQLLADQGFNPLKTLNGQRGIRHLPFVWVFGRSNFTVSYFGANIYPENVTVGLEQPTIREWVTGKFVLQAREDEERNRKLCIAVEMAPGVEGDEEKRAAIASSILTHLLRLNSEFAHYVPAEYRMPEVELAPAGDTGYFPVGVKHRYTRK